MLPFERLSVNGVPMWYLCESAWRWAPPALPDFDLWFVRNGRGELKLNGRRFALSSGVCFVLRPGCRPLGWHDPQHPLQVFFCHFTLRGLNAAQLWPDGALVNDVAFFVASAQRAQILWRRGDDESRELARRVVEGMLLALWDEARQPSLSPQERALDELAEFVRREPAKAWNLDGMAGEVHLSRAQFVRRFRARFGSSPMAFVSQIRLERAQQLLRESDLSLDAVARAVGMGDAPFLSRNFKTVTGTSPGVWRKLAKNSESFSAKAIDSEEESL